MTDDQCPTVRVVCNRLRQVARSVGYLGYNLRAIRIDEVAKRRAWCRSAGCAMSEGMQPENLITNVDRFSPQFTISGEWYTNAGLF